MTRQVEIRAPAKVNLRLRVLERRADGFHDIRTVLQAVGLYDVLCMERVPEPGVTLVVRGAELGPPEENLVARAARAFLDAGRIRGGVRVELEKSIPAGAGLGGGSSDAAAALRAMETLFELELAPGTRQSLAQALGSDVPFFLGPGGLALGEGRGERVTALPPLPLAGVVLGLPPVHVATGPAYGVLAESRREGGGGALQVDRDPRPWPRDWEQVAVDAVNDFQPVIVPAHPPVGRALDALRAGRPLLALLSGSGGAVFAVHTSLGEAEDAALRAARLAPETRFLAVPTLAELPGPSARGP